MLHARGGRSFILELLLLQGVRDAIDGKTAVESARIPSEGPLPNARM
jgi:hypothetical protein